ncbi:MAG: hypothetical protein K6A69_07995 [Lachnospiraceae bacterium]|nr:hypothetical protein [Lachnospiraceae bacterium]
MPALILGGSTWTLTADSYISALTCDADAIDLNGYKLIIDGESYTEGTSAEGAAFIFTQESTGVGAPPDGEGGPQGGGTPPSGNNN